MHSYSTGNSLETCMADGYVGLPLLFTIFRHVFQENVIASHTFIRSIPFLASNPPSSSKSNRRETLSSVSEALNEYTILMRWPAYPENSTTVNSGSKFWTDGRVVEAEVPRVCTASLRVAITWRAIQPQLKASMVYFSAQVCICTHCYRVLIFDQITLLIINIKFYSLLVFDLERSWSHF